MRDFDGMTIFWCTLVGAALACAIIVWLGTL